LALVNRVQGRRSLVLAADESHAISLSDRLLEFEEGLDSYVADLPRRTSRLRYIGRDDMGHIVDDTPPETERLISLPRKAWDACFPMLVPVGADDAVLVLDSVSPASNIVTNALGTVGRDQLRKARTLVRVTAHRSVVLAMHHQAVGAGPLQRLLRLTDAAEIIRFVKSEGFPLVLCGHTHVGDAQLLSNSLWITAPLGAAGRALRACLGGSSREPSWAELGTSPKN
jgi:hypothetical protein